MLDGEPLVEEYKDFDLVTNMNCCLFGCLKSITKINQPRLSMVIEASGNLTTH
jgi:hypothetical protein